MITTDNTNVPPSDWRANNIPTKIKNKISKTTYSMATMAINFQKFRR